METVGYNTSMLQLVSGVYYQMSFNGGLKRGEETLVMTSLSTADRYRVILKQEYPDYINATLSRLG